MTSQETERVFYSRIFSDLDGFVHATYDLGQSTLARVDLADAVMRHKPIAASDAPKDITLESGKKIGSSRKDGFLMEDKLLVISPRLRDILVQFNLGACQLFETPVRRLRAEDYPNHYILNVTERKDSFIPEASTNLKHLPNRLREDGSRVDFYTPLYNRDNLTVSRAALEGVDLWAETSVLSRLFFSGRLAAAIQAAKLDRTSFRLVEAGVQ